MGLEARTGDKSADVFPVVGSCCIGFDGGVADIPSQSPSGLGGSRELDLAAYWIILVELEGLAYL